MDKFEKRIRFPRGAFDKRSPVLKENYGIGSAIGYFALIGPKGAISWEFSTGWDLPHIRKLHGSRDPAGFAIVIHHPKQVFAFDPEPTQNCELIGGPCWTDAGYTAGDEFMAALIEHGEDGVWRLAEGWYEAHLAEKVADVA